MNLKAFLSSAALIGLAGVSTTFASMARVESMGKTSSFIMDDISIFDNPANINIFPNYLIGEMGPYQGGDLDKLEAGGNQDPVNPWFGGIFSLPLGKEDSRDPRLAIAGALNRKDANLMRFLPNQVVYVDNNNRDITVSVPAPVTNFDGFLGGTTPEGNMIGLHIYTAVQDGAVENNGEYEIDPNAFASIVKADAGINWEMSQDVDMELSAGVARIMYGPQEADFFDPEMFSIFGMGRLFSTIEMLNGELVPVGRYSFIQADGIEEQTILGGLGVNVALDRGFFWLGLEIFNKQLRAHHWSFGETNTYHYSKTESANWEVKEQNGGTLSFGIERNIWWDWFVIRVGGSKSLAYVDCNANSKNQTAVNNATPMNPMCSEDGSYFATNPVGDGTIGDHVGFGIGINVEEKLKVDATLAEDMLYRNPFQGSGRLISRVSATYSF
jgi:hypothetical protein